MVVYDLSNLNTDDDLGISVYVINIRAGRDKCDDH